MDLKKRIQILSRLAEFISEENEELQQEVEKAFQHNKWFTRENVWLSLKNIRDQFLDEKKINSWLSHYELSQPDHPKNVGIVMAGNIPLVGFHDFLCVFLSGHHSMIKLSSKDDVLFPFLLNKLCQWDEGLQQEISVSEILKGIDAAIATGSNNSSKYFQYYFGKYPHIIRKNRSSVAVLSGNESADELAKLGIDIFSYFGLGCRNVSKLFIPRNYSFDLFFNSIEKFYGQLNDHNKYKNNFDYNHAIFLMNNIPFLTNDFLILKEDEKISSPVAVLHYEFYEDEEDLRIKLRRNEEHIQCLVGNQVANSVQDIIAFGETQSPQLWDYADKIDTFAFLLSFK